MQYEYLKVPAKEFTNLSGRRINVEALNKFGAEGWELVTFTFSMDLPAWGYFKREKVLMPVQSTGDLLTLQLEFRKKLDHIIESHSGCIWWEKFRYTDCKTNIINEIVELRCPLDNRDTKSVG